MALAITVTRGHTFAANTPYDVDDLNAAALPVVSIAGSVSTDELAAGAVTAAKATAGAFFFATTGGSANAYTLAPSNAILSYTNGLWLLAEIHATNTGATTINVSSLGAKKVFKRTDQELGAGDLKIEQMVLLQYNSSLDGGSGAFELVSTPGKPYTLYAADGGSTDAYSITVDYQVNAYSDLVGVPIVFKANTANTSGCSLNVNALGAQTIFKHLNVAMETGDIKSGQIVTVVYDGTNFQLQAPPGPPSALLQTAVFEAFHFR